VKSRHASIHLLKAVAVVVTVTWQKPGVAGAQPSDAVLSGNGHWSGNLCWLGNFSSRAFSVEGRLTSSSQQLSGALPALGPGEGRQLTARLLAWFIARGLQLGVNCLGGQWGMCLPNFGSSTECSQRAQLRMSG